MATSHSLPRASRRASTSSRSAPARATASTPQTAARLPGTSAAPRVLPQEPTHSRPSPPARPVPPSLGSPHRKTPHHLTSERGAGNRAPLAFAITHGG